MVYFYERSLFVIVVCMFLILPIKLIFFRYIKTEMMCYKKHAVLHYICVLASAQENLHIRKSQNILSMSLSMQKTMDVR
ncbi:hypothetical protein M942_04095 [Enterobacter ludwigii]|nr:hypothetical protein M942_04095 [Enterobacter ludwigii]KLP39979.1 hypothetical protein ABR36_10260 [Enterobacter ludwigii]